MNCSWICSWNSSWIIHDFFAGDLRNAFSRKMWHPPHLRYVTLEWPLVVFWLVDTKSLKNALYATWAMKKAQVKKLDVAEMKMLRWMSGVTKLDRIRNERIRGTTKVGEISKKVQESRLKWYGYVLRREDECVGKRVMGMEVPGKRRRGRPKWEWLDSFRNDFWERIVKGGRERPS